MFTVVPVHFAPLAVQTVGSHRPVLFSLSMLMIQLFILQYYTEHSAKTRMSGNGWHKLYSLKAVGYSDKVWCRGSPRILVRDGTMHLYTGCEAVLNEAFRGFSQSLPFKA